MAYISHSSEALLIDGDPTTSQEFVMVLDATFHSVRLASDFESAGKLLKLQNIDLIICDLYPTTITSDQIASMLELEIACVFLDRGQHAGVRIKRIGERGFICLNKLVAIELLPMFCEQAIRRQMSSRSAFKPTLLKPANIFSGLFTNPETRTNIHSLY